MRIALIASMIVVLLAPAAHARDFCFNSTSPPNPAPPGRQPAPVSVSVLHEAASG